VYLHLHLSISNAVTDEFYNDAADEKKEHVASDILPVLDTVYFYHVGLMNINILAGKVALPASDRALISLV
ncbi:putative UDP-N-acetylglucosamine pyrophosphorylase, partial [Clarias magur]